MLISTLTSAGVFLRKINFPLNALRWTSCRNYVNTRRCPKHIYTTRIRKTQENSPSTYVDTKEQNSRVNIHYFVELSLNSRV